MNEFTAEDREKLGRYHDGTHEACVSCRMLQRIEALEARVEVLEMVLARERRKYTQVAEQYIALTAIDAAKAARIVVLEEALREASMTYTDGPLC